MIMGGLGFFFFGMKLMSESLQTVAGDVIRNSINSLTSNRFLAISVGMMVAMLIQSSSMTTVMVVGLVNAGLMHLTQAIGVILGANIGTTITGWIISMNIGLYGYVFVSLGVIPIIFAKSSNKKFFGRFLFGIGLIFIGLDTMSSSFIELKNYEGFVASIEFFKGSTYSAYIASTLFGCILTMLIQSSSTTLAITMALATAGLIDFNTAVAMILGENIGTTVTALIASIGGNTTAKQAARAHAVFNLTGVLLIYLILPFYMEFVDWLVPGKADLVDPGKGTHPLIARHIAAAHTIFNVSGVLIFIPFLNFLAKIVSAITPEPIGKEERHLVHLGNVSEVLPATALISALEELKKQRDILGRMYKLTREYIQLDVPDARLFAKIKKYEGITDNVQKEVTVYLCKVMEREMSAEQSSQLQALVRIADEFESIGDYLERVATYKTRFQENLMIKGEAKKQLLKFSDSVWELFNTCSEALLDNKINNLKECEVKGEDLRIMANEIRDNHILRVSQGEYGPLSSLTYSDMIVAFRKVRAHALNVVQALESFQ